jgi:hypothetical protein
MGRIKYGHGKGSIEMTGVQKDLIESTIRSAEPIMSTILKSVVEEIANNAEKNWLVRQRKFGRSKDSKGQISTGFRVIPPNTIEAFVENTAEYAWAIKVGSTSETNIPEGRRLADVLLWTPARKQANNIVWEIARKTVRNIRKIKDDK